MACAHRCRRQQVIACSVPLHAMLLASLLTTMTRYSCGNPDGEPSQTPVTSDEAPPSLPYWSRGQTRPFLAGGAILGLGYGRLTLGAGYGKPHWIWVGPESTGVLTPYFASVQGGIHLSAAIVELALSLKRTHSFRHGLMPKIDSVTPSDLERTEGTKAQYTALDASLGGFIPYGQLLVGWELTYLRPLQPAATQLLYEESQRIVVSRLGVVTSKLTPMWRLHRSHPVYAGVLVELLGLLGRHDPIVVRIGPSAWAQLADHWDLVCLLSWPVKSPDRLGFWDGMYGTAGVMYRFATGEPRSPIP